MEIKYNIKKHLKKIWGIVSWSNDVKLQARSINDYINSNKVKKLQFGCGPNSLKGWLNTDIYKSCEDAVYLDITKPLPLPENSFEYMISEHLIEHITFDEATSFLKECYRKLKPNGKIRITTPNLEKIIGLYHHHNQPKEKEYIDHIVKEFLPSVSRNSEVFVINNAFRNWGHQFLYNKTTLINLLEDTGFVMVTEKRPGISDDEHFINVDIRDQSAWKNINNFEVMVFEATKA